MTSQIRKLGEKLIVALPPDLLARLGWDVGDVLSAEILEDGIKFTRTKTAHDHAMEIARDVMDEYRETFEALAKS
jgi:antitoxin component of MazEF toxin-antitoxin module